MKSYRALSEKKLLLATHNQGKVKEIAALLAPYGLEIMAAGDLGLKEPIEDGQTFAQNARIKALTCAKETNMVALSDDSGLVIPALEGVPGIYSARWAGPQKDFQHAFFRIELALGGHSFDKQTGQSSVESSPSSTVFSYSIQGPCDAYFICALCLAWPDGHTQIFEGRVDGHIQLPARGKSGFGYDSIFVPLGYTQTFGEMDPTFKHSISHRAKAFDQLTKACF